MNGNQNDLQKARDRRAMLRQEFHVATELTILNGPGLFGYRILICQLIGRSLKRAERDVETILRGERARDWDGRWKP